MTTALEIAIFALIGLGFVFIALDGVRKAGGKQRGRRWTEIVCGLLVAYGGVAFFAQALAAAGGLRFLGPSVEWPVGTPDAVTEDSQGRRVASLAGCGRIQVYANDGQFLKGWFVDASGGVFKVRVAADDKIEVFTARGRRRLRYSPDGVLLERGRYAGGYSELQSGPPVVASFRTPLLLWPFAHPAAGWSVAAVGMVGLVSSGRRRRRTAR